MADIDDREASIPVVHIEEPVRKEQQYVYRVSWIVIGKRKEEFYGVRSWADKRAKDLQKYAEELQIEIQVLVGEVEIKGDENACL